jgi:hypothetical protein
MMKRVLLCFALALICFQAAALTVSSSELELEIHEQNGRFSVHAIQQSGDKVALLVAEDPRTTMLTILAGSKVYRMGDSFEFRQTIESASNSASIIWTSARFTVRQTFSLDGSTLTITLLIENTSEQDQDIGVRYLLDTYLGEEDIHFSADGLAVEKETNYAWVAPYKIQSSNDDTVSLSFLLTGESITDPDRVVIANWKRLNDASWTYEVNPTRGFSLLPYSINDSAIALYFEPDTVASSTSRTISFKLDWQKPGFVFQSTVDSTGASRSESGLVDTVLDEVTKIDSVLAKIDELLRAGTPPSDADIQNVRSLLEVLLQRREEFSQRQ